METINELKLRIDAARQELLSREIPKEPEVPVLKNCFSCESDRVDTISSSPTLNKVCCHSCGACTGWVRGKEIQAIKIWNYICNKIETDISIDF